MTFTQLANMKYIIRPRASRKIFSFYQNVAKKYRHTYDKDDLKRNVKDAVLSVYGIEQNLPRRKPTIARWAGYYMANTDKWYFAYTIEGDTITIVDDCHAQNMH